MLTTEQPTHLAKTTYLTYQNMLKTLAAGVRIYRTWKSA